MPHVFISYVRENGDVVDRLASELKNRVVTVWLDRNDLRARGYAGAPIVQMAGTDSPGLSALNLVALAMMTEIGLLDRRRKAPLRLNQRGSPLSHQPARRRLLRVRWRHTYTRN